MLGVRSWKVDRVPPAGKRQRLVAVREDREISIFYELREELWVKLRTWLDISVVKMRSPLTCWVVTHASSAALPSRATRVEPMSALTAKAEIR